MKLDAAAARRAIERRLARQLGATVEEAAFAIRETITRQMAAETALRIRQVGADAKDFTLFSFGGGGPLHACKMAELAGIARVVAFPYGSVFSAFGGSTTSVRHSYFKTLGIPAGRGPEIDDLVAELRSQALRDMSGEGFAPKDVDLTLEVAVLQNGATKLHKLNGKTMRTGGSIGGRLKKSRATIESVQLTAESEIDRWTPRKLSATGRGVPPKRGARDIRWERGQATATPVYDRFALRPGHSVAGPALVEGPDTVYAVDPGWALAVDSYGNFVLTRG
jgi:N-methylhydantoinase A/oxoprolinase/acetone carboxylase beta subunit